MKKSALKCMVLSALVTGVTVSAFSVPTLAASDIRVGSNIAQYATVRQSVESKLQSDTLEAVNDGLCSPARAHVSGGENPYAWTNYKAVQNGEKSATLGFNFDQFYYVDEVVLYQFVDSYSADLPDRVEFRGNAAVPQLHSKDVLPFYVDITGRLQSSEYISETCVKCTYELIYDGSAPLLFSLDITEYAAEGQKQKDKCIGLYEVEIIGDRAGYPLTYPYESGFISVNNYTATVASEDSEHGGSAALLNDGDAFTMWHTSWNGCDAKDRYVILDLGEVRSNVTGLNYIGRFGAGDGDNNGRVGAYRVEVSTDGVNWLVADEGEWEDTAGTKNSWFGGNLSARYVKLTGLSTYGSRGNANKFMSAAEIDIILNVKN